MQYSYKKKIVPLSAVLEYVSMTKKNEKKIVFTNGCFDILHRGHIYYLRESRRLGDMLVVGLNSDASVRRLKGSDRPINCEQDRAYLLEALDFVDYIVIFDDDTPLKLINVIKPDYYTKSGEYTLENMIGPNLGSDIIESYGGTAVLIHNLGGYSSSSLIQKKAVEKYEM